MTKLDKRSVAELIAGLLAVTAALRDWFAPGFMAMKVHDPTWAPMLLAVGALFIGRFLYRHRRRPRAGSTSN